MKKSLLSALFLFLVLNVFSQTTFKEAYYINIENDSVHGLIKDMDWSTNPKHFVFKKTEEGLEEKITPEKVLLFEILNSSKYRSSKVQIDVSDSNLDNLSKQKQANFETRQLFLKTIIEGKASLYSYSTDQYVRYFIETEKNQIFQLVHKSYINEQNQIAENNRFRQQLLINLDCNAINSNSLKDLKYNQKELIKLIQLYNSCFDEPSIDFTSLSHIQKSFNLSVRAGIQLARLSATSNGNSSTINNFDDEFSYRVGLELEYILPFKPRNWSAFLEPNYQSYSTDLEADPLLIDNYQRFEYQSIVLNLGFRYYVFLKNEQQLFLNAGVAQDFDFYSSVIDEFGTEFEISAAVNPFIGVGYNFNDTLSLEVRYHHKRNLFSNYASRNTDFRTIALIFGYRVW